MVHCTGRHSLAKLSRHAIVPGMASFALPLVVTMRLLPAAVRATDRTVSTPDDMAVAARSAEPAITLRAQTSGTAKEAM